MLPCVSLVVNPCALADARAQAEDTYFQANNWASYDDWRRARDQWDYFCKRLFLLLLYFFFSVLMECVLFAVRILHSCCIGLFVFIFLPASLVVLRQSLCLAHFL